MTEQATMSVPNIPSVAQCGREIGHSTVEPTEAVTVRYETVSSMAR